MRKWFKSGDPWVWLNAAAVSVSLIVVLGLIMLIAVRGFGHFWATPVFQAEYQLPGTEAVLVIGEVHESEVVSVDRLKNTGVNVEGLDPRIERQLVKVGNRDLLGSDFRWVPVPFLKNIQYPENIVVIERREWGNFFGFLVALKRGQDTIAQGDATKEHLAVALERAQELHKQIRVIEKSEIGSINYSMERLRLQRRGYELEKELTPEIEQKLAQERSALESEYQGLQKRLNELYTEIKRDVLVAKISDGRELNIPLAQIVRFYEPNAMGLFSKLAHYIEKLVEFVFDEPRESNTEGGIFPAIFGTVMMVIIMAIIVTPFGVVAAVYLSEYAKQGFLTRVIRIAVNNLAGVPSIVYGVFGLGFFVYFLGGSLDQLFFPEALPSPTFGTPGILWSSLTLAILTVPVVIVATEEGLSRVPKAIREGSLALGATKAETLWRTVLPMTTPAMMTGLILAVARAAGEVAPLMLVGVVKLAPTLPMDGDFPFLHLDRKFMHLGFHIYDVGFQSPNVEAARPLVYATALLLVAVIIVLNLAAIYFRNRLREKYRS
ncbi:MAG: phosphate ABC transporter permease PstA [Gammaproteobacteria bacterium]|nr:phosphate ABC transporter permease PstA [Gammaproteobacteria bacterium]MDH5692489.1 phosphate ABC transporter permease PstA [Gammaproteobacteria bacterium]